MYKMDWLPREEDTTCPMTIQAIIPEKFYDETPTVRIYAAVLNSSKHISRIVKSLGEILPIPSLKHLKRVKRHEDNTYVILDRLPEVEEVEECPSKKFKFDGISYLKELRSKGFHYEEFGVVDVEECEVPKFGPLSRVQYEKALKYWPVNFHPEKKLETMMSKKIFDDPEEQHHLSCMRYIMRESLKKKSSIALVVDFMTKQYVAMGVERVGEHPLQHAVMVAVDAVASTYGGGAWDLPFTTLTFSNETPQNRIEMDLEPGEEEMAPYLCTGYDLYVLREPCVMCAMSLVHSRIKRVFFYVRDLEKGALVSRCQIQAIKELNHHYDVFEIVRE